MFSSAKKDNRYFISRTQYNCPYCSTGAVRFKVKEFFDFNWSDNETRRCVLIECQEPDCGNVSLHMSKHNVSGDDDLDLPRVKITDPETKEEKWVDWEKVYSIDEVFFYHHPNSSFVIDERIPEKIRQALDESSTCNKMSLPIGASASLRKSIFQLLAYFEIPKTRNKTKGNKEEIEGIPYLERLDLLKEKVSTKYPNVDSSLFANIKKIYSLVSIPLHERLPNEIEWEDFTSEQFKFLAGIVHNLLLQIFVETGEREKRNEILSKLAEKIPGFGKSN